VFDFLKRLFGGAAKSAALEKSNLEIKPVARYVDTRPVAPDAMREGKAPPDAAKTNPDRSEDIEYLKSYASQLVRGGYHSAAECVDIIEEYAEDDDLIIDAKPLIEGEISKLEADQKTWPDVTDYDRLHQVLSTLQTEGIVARENFTCCGNCGHAEIGEEIALFNEAGGHAEGYAFFHQQDTESAVDHGGIYLAYGTADLELRGEAYDKASVKIGQRIQKAFETAGMDVVWNGAINQRLHVEIDWKRRWTNLA
jgi:hypothetical protein